jgi:hypothetical protein
VGVSSLTAAKATITAGTSTSLQAVFVNATDATIDQGVGQVSSGSPVAVSPLATTTYTLTANGPGGPVIRTVTVTVVAPASITSFGASPGAMVTGQASQLTAVFTGGSGSIDHGIGPVASDTPVSTGALSASASYTLTVANAAGDAVTASTTVTAGPAVAITGFTAARTVISAGSSTTLTPSFVNQTGASIDQGVGPVSSGSAFTVSPPATTTYTLTAAGLGGPVTRPVTITVVPLPAIASFGAAPAALVSGNSAQLTAVFSQGTGSITPGNIPVASGAPVSTGPLAASTTFTLTVTNPAGDTAAASATVTVGSQVAITGFAAARTIITAGSSTTLLPGFVNATDASIDQGVGPVNSGTGVTVSPAATTTYTLTAADAVSTVSQAVTVTVVAPPGITSFGASPGALVVGQSSQLTAVFTGGAGAIDHGIGPVVSGAPVSTGALAASTGYTLTVTDAAGDAATASTTVTAGPAVAITGFAAARPVISVGASTTLTPFFVNQAGASVDQDVGPVISGSAFTVSPPATTTYTLTATGLGGPVSQTATVTVVPPPAIASFNASPAAVPIGTSTQLTAVFSGGQGSVDQGLGAVTSGVPISTGALSASTTFTLTVTNPAGDTAAASDTVTAGSQVGITGFTSARPIITAGTSVTLLPVFVNASDASIDHGVGLVSSGAGVSVSPAATTTYTLTADGLGGPVTRTVTVTVVAPASITSFTASPGAIISGQTTQLTAVFAGGTGVIDNGVGSVTSGQAASTSPLAASTSFGLTVTNAAGDSVTASALATVNYQVTFAAAQGGTLTGSTSQIVAYGGSCTPVTANPPGGEGLENWTGTGGFATVQVNPLTVQNVTANMAITAHFNWFPVIGSFAALSSTINLGQEAVLTWSGVDFFTTASIDHTVGAVTSTNGMAGMYPAATTTFTLTASNDVGTATATATVTVITKPVINVFTAAPASVTIGQSSLLSWTVTGIGTTLSLNQGIGSVTGTSSISVSPAVTTTYTLTATTAAGSTTAAATVTVTAVPPAGLAYGTNPAVYTKGLPIAPDSPSNSGGAITSYGVAPALPAGLNLDPNSGVISGTPTAVTPGAAYVVTGTNSGGPTQASLTLTVNDAAPALGSPTGTYTWHTGSAVTPLVPGNSGGAVVTWSIAPGLPAGLAFSLANGSISGTPTAASALQTYTITATNTGGSSSVTPSIAVVPSAPVISVQPFGQIISQGAPVTFSVAASGSGTLACQWFRNGSPIATGPSYSLSAVAPADDQAVFTVTVSDTYGNSTASDPAILSLYQDLPTWLANNPTIAAAIKWQVSAVSGNVYLPPTDANKVVWNGWSPSQQADLVAAYNADIAWYNQGAPQVTMIPGSPGLTDQPANQYGNQSDSISTMLWVTPAYMWQLYTAHVAFSLMLETSHQIPWSITDGNYSSDALKWLFDSASMAWYLLSSGDYSMGTYPNAGMPTYTTDNRPRTGFADPRWTYPWLKQAGLLGATRQASIGKTLDWMRYNLSHFYGTTEDPNEDFGTDYAVWQYRGFSPVSQIINGTVDSRYPALGTQHWTAGCHGSVGFLNAILRVVNIPVQPIWACGHEMACFMSEGLYLDHGDDPYNSVVKAWDPSYSILLLLIDSATYQSRFGDPTLNLLDDSSPACAYIGYQAANPP